MNLTDMQRDSALSAPVGLAAGDALGASYESRTSGRYSRYAWTVRPPSSAHASASEIIRLVQRPNQRGPQDNEIRVPAQTSNRSCDHSFD